MDGVEVEAYGHLFDQFWSPATNQRNEGGSFENRMRFPLAVLRSFAAGRHDHLVTCAWRSTKRT